MKIDFSGQKPGMRHANIRCDCPMWQTSRFCELSESHLLNLYRSPTITSFMPELIYRGLLDELRARGLLFNPADIPTEYAVVTAYKQLRLHQRNESRAVVTPEVLANAEKYLLAGKPMPVETISVPVVTIISMFSQLAWEKTTHARCDRANQAISGVPSSMDDHFSDEVEYRRVHGNLTGCGIYAYQHWNYAYNYSEIEQNTVVVALSLHGVVIDVGLRGQHMVNKGEVVPGYQAQTATIEMVWLPAERYDHTNVFNMDRAQALADTYSVPVYAMPDRLVVSSYSEETKLETAPPTELLAVLNREYPFWLK